ncbi:hypothetical protein BY996DRAFT_4344208 [Phakopsora pachyrhizi]|nr:hypothetical protein BY996DRAFT_4344208 [Phakopsora pachyrhizi]
MPQSSRKFKVEEETSEILKTLGIKKSKPSNSSSRINQDWEEIDDGDEMVMAEDDGDEKGVRNEQLKTPKASSKLRLPSGPQDFMNQTSPSETQGSKNYRSVLNGSSNKSSYSTTTPSKTINNNSLTSEDSNRLVNDLKSKLSQIQVERDRLVRQVEQLRSLSSNPNGTDLIQGRILKADGVNGCKVLGSKELEDLQKQFETQEKLLAGYQKENERALIELEQAKSRMLKMSNLLSKAYGPDWEQMIILPTTGTSGSNHQMALENSQPLQSTATKIRDEEERIDELIRDENDELLDKNNQEKLTLQLSQIQLLVQGMEKRLIVRESELIDLNQRAMSDHQSLKEKLEQISKR